MKKIKAVAFDIDGTLYSNFQLYSKIWFYFLRHLRFFISFNRVRKILHKTAPLPDFYEYQRRLLAKEMKISVEEAKNKINTIVYEGFKPYFKKIKTIPHVEETFVKFKKCGLKIALLSDFPPEQKGDIWNLAQYCDVILGSEALGALKPSKYPFGILAKKLDLPAEQILYVGNNVRCDVKGAKNFGMKSAYLLPFWRKIFNKKHNLADISFKNYRQLQKIVLQYT
ncbi:MAG: HAD family hydrolase [Treponema sp.]|nr:HAD family hydrolase [Treponema sp.]